jgi:energy-coupling factor transporter ATP-binding protein EcfA2
MALEELIVDWSNERPTWQREVMRRVAAGDVFSDGDYDRLVEDIVAAKHLPEPRFGLEQLPQAAAEDSPVRLLAIEKPEHVNALESRDPLTFEPQGLTIVYGDNGSGKSGYARLLKRITRARHQEEVLTDVFRDTSLAKPTAVLSVRIGDADVSLDWPELSCPELQRVRFYDAECGNAYISSESDFPYLPSALLSLTASSKPASQSGHASTQSLSRTALRPKRSPPFQNRLERPMQVGSSRLSLAAHRSQPWMRSSRDSIRRLRRSMNSRCRCRASLESGIQDP